MTDAQDAEPYTNGKLYKVLYDGLPNHRSNNRKDRLDVRTLAEDLGVTYQAVYKWFWANSLPPKKIKRILGLPGCTLTQQDLLPLAIPA